MHILKFEKNLFILVILFLGLSSCNANQTNQVQRANPTPIPSNVESSVSGFENFINKPFPSNTPIPSSSVNLADYNFNLEINFNARLPRVSVDDGEIKQPPITYTLKGGTHKVIIFDLVTGCWIGRNYVIDKNSRLNYTLQKDCNF